MTNPKLCKITRSKGKEGKKWGRIWRFEKKGIERALDMPCLRSILLFRQSSTWEQTFARFRAKRGRSCKNLRSEQGRKGGSPNGYTTVINDQGAAIAAWVLAFLTMVAESLFWCVKLGKMELWWNIRLKLTSMEDFTEEKTVAVTSFLFP